MRPSFIFVCICNGFLARAGCVSRCDNVKIYGPLQVTANALGAGMENVLRVSTLCVWTS